MVNDEILKVYVNPFIFFEIDENWSHLGHTDLSIESVLKFLCTPDDDSSATALIERYKVINDRSEPPQPVEFPHDQCVVFPQNIQRQLQAFP